jgi:NAD(P)H-hydrate epimerase
VALDLPSGVCSDTGQIRGSAVQADCTVTFGLPKLGLALEPGRTCAGRVEVARIGIVDSAPGVADAAELWTAAAAGAHLPERPADGHKGRFGHALLVAGSEGMTGAAALAAAGALRAGAGLVTLGCPRGVNEILELKCTEAMTVPLADTAERRLAAGAQDRIVELAAERNAVGIGPGIGRDAETAKLVRAVVPRVDVPLALDADALHAYHGCLDTLQACRAERVLTPHPGEAAALLDSSPQQINRDRPAAARQLAERSGAVVLLKGAASVVAAPEGRLLVNPTGGPALASGGTGDVLLGMLVALLAQGLPAFEAAALAAYWHGFTSDRLSQRLGPAGLLASDLAAALPESGYALRRAASEPPVGARLAVSFPEP